VEAGQKALEAARAGNQTGLTLSAPMTVSRMQPLNVPAASLRAIFSADAAKLPGWAGVASAEGYRLYRINRVAEGEMPAEQIKAMRNDMRRLLAQEEMRAYLESAKARKSQDFSQRAGTQSGRRGNAVDQARVEGFRDDVVAAEFQFVQFVGIQHLLRHRFARQFGQGAGGGDHHRLGDGLGAGVEGALEDVGKPSTLLTWFG
jgi:hypothetical protein